MERLLLASTSGRRGEEGFLLLGGGEEGRGHFRGLRSPRNERLDGPYEACCRGHAERDRAQQRRSRMDG